MDLSYDSDATEYERPPEVQEQYDALKLRQKESRALYYKKNKERFRESQKRWRESNGNKAKEYVRKWQEKNMDKVYESIKKYQENNKDKIKEYNRLRYLENIERHKDLMRNYSKTEKGKQVQKESAKKYYKTEKGKMSLRKVQYKRKYGITIEQVDQMLKDQNGLCACCTTILGSIGVTHKERNSSSPHIDHDHVTNKIRSILCASCNILLGHACDSIVRLEQAIAYLKKHQPLSIST